MRKEGKTPTVVIFCSLVSLYSFSRCHCGHQSKSSIFLPPDLSSPALVSPSFGGCNPGLSRYEGKEGKGRGRGKGRGKGRERRGRRKGRERRDRVGEGKGGGSMKGLSHCFVML